MAINDASTTRLGADPTATPRPARSRRRSRAKPRPPRPRAVVLAELRGFAGLVHEWALMDRTAQPVPSWVEWANSLAGELGVEGVTAPRTTADMLMQIREINRRALAADASGDAEAA